MINNKTIAVVVPAYNEESQIGMVIETMPDFVDRIVVVNDGSRDKTAEVVQRYIEKDKKEVVLIEKPDINKQEETAYNKADILLQKKRTEEESLYPRYKVVSDGSTGRIVLINEDNSGVGTAIAVGYKWCRDYRIDCTAVMAGDGQMDPSELYSIILPVIEDNIDYVKGNRLAHPAAQYIVPKIRYLGNNVLSLMTKIRNMKASLL